MKDIRGALVREGDLVVFNYYGWGDVPELKVVKVTKVRAESVDVSFSVSMFHYSKETQTHSIEEVINLNACITEFVKIN